MKVSVVMVTLNASSFIRDVLDSLRGQSFRNFEIIIVDNGSTDGTIELLEKGYPEAKLIKNKENLGFPQANNQGITLAKGAVSYTHLTLPTKRIV